MIPSERCSRRTLLGGALVAGIVGLAGCAPATTGAPSTPSPTPASSPTPTPTPTPTAGLSPAERATITARHQGRTPTAWGLELEDVVLRSDADAVVLTLDACGGPGGEGGDSDLLDLLRAEGVPATLFLNARWIEANRAVVDRLAGEELFELANHGTRHLPLSVSGRQAYGITGTGSVAEVVDEVYGNHELMTTITGMAPRFFRPGTAYFDDVAVDLVRELGEIPVNFDVNADAGATFSASQVAAAVEMVRPGSIIIGHMNQPGGDTAEGLAVALPRLIAAGHRFARLGDVGLQ